MVEVGADKNLDFARRGLSALLQKRQFGPGKALGDYVTFSCNAFSLNLVFYRADLWAEVYQNQHPDDAIALENLLQFLSLASSNGRPLPTPADGRDASSLHLRQLSAIAADIDTHFDVLSAFFREGEIAPKLVAVRKFVIARHPDLFRRRGDP